ncbi:MAG TPA: hypothetical protein VGG10_22265 [Rhizomicrobium sp.]|jgi:hypothetical protein
MRSAVMTRPVFLHRYTSLLNVVQMLEMRALTLRSPLDWEDRNDAYALELYKKRTGAKSVAAVCFTQADETYHHWKVFAATGACVAFDRVRLVRALKGIEGLKTGSVRYREIRKLARTPPSVAQLPFLKRYPYRDENEFRLVFAADDADFPERAFPIPLASIRRITLSPWLSHEELADAKRTIKKIAGCGNLKVYRTTVLDNRDWKRALAAARG